MFKHILLATDGSPACEYATILAAGLARQNNAPLSAVFVVDPYPYIGVGDLNPAGFQAYMAAAQERAEKALAGVKAVCAQGQPPVQLDTRVIENMAAHSGICQAATELQADLVVVGSHGRSGVVRMVLGSVAAKVVAASPAPVLVARA